MQVERSVKELTSFGNQDDFPETLLLVNLYYGLTVESD